MELRADGSFTMLRPSNFHAHFRQGAMMHAVTKHILHHVQYALAMPNTGPITTVQEAYAYHQRLYEIVKEEGLRHVKALIMTVYHTALITPEVIERIARSLVVRAVKHYPPHPGATTGAGLGQPLEEADEMLRAMEDTGVPLLGHFESVYDKNGRELPHEEREGYMVDHVLWKLRDRYPRLRICFEHASTRKAVEFVRADVSGRTVMTVTPQHSLFIDSDLEEDTLGTHLKCMPIVKTPDDRGAILEFITSGDYRAIAGDDTAPHPSASKSVEFKDANSGCWLPHSTALYATAFEKAGALDARFEQFMSLNGPSWWRLPEPTDTILVNRVDDGVPAPVEIPGVDDVIVPLGWTQEARFPVHYQVS